eukprot:TRINITY_DN12129_c0_g1_i1.p1 TRINITY_DN12129_c0_g1~~TRINITY_DN12129_c0_g1_i1.p1  ORF type:complete len:144 (+),score=57.89 TRINITY_DN12129_c0_g1_i1:171-602(+)
MCIRDRMSNEDWLQLTYRVEYFEKYEETALSKKENEERIKADEMRKMQEDAKKGAVEGEEGSAAAKKTEEVAGVDEKEMLDKGYKKVVEYPVFEVRLGDGVKVTSLFPFIIVGVMRKDGARFGRDAQDATNLRKQFDRSSKWW